METAEIFDYELFRLYSDSLEKAFTDLFAFDFLEFIDFIDFTEVCDFLSAAE